MGTYTKAHTRGPEGWAGGGDGGGRLYPPPWKLACLSSSGTETRMWDQRHTLASTYWFHSRSRDSLPLSLSPSPLSSSSIAYLLSFPCPSTRTNLVAYSHPYPLPLTSYPLHVPWSEFFLFSVHPSSYRIRHCWHPLNPLPFLLYFTLNPLFFAQRELYSLSEIVTNVHRQPSRVSLWEPTPFPDVARRVSLSRKDPPDRGTTPRRGACCQIEVQHAICLC